MEERKDYLVEKLSENEEKVLITLVLNERRRYIKKNYNYLNNTCIELSDISNMEADSVLEAVINKYEEEVKSAIEFEKVISNGKLYNSIKALSLKEKMVLFCLYKENKSVQQIAIEMRKTRETIWRIKNKALDKIMRSLIGGEYDDI